MVNRMGFIGGSDVAAALGMSRWKSPLQLWAEKTGEVEPTDLSEVEAVQLGTELEDFVAKKFEKKTGLKVRRAPKDYIHPNFDYMRCQVDRLIEGRDELLECKTCSAWKAKEWDGEDIPQEYIIQVMWQLGVTGRSVGYIAVLIGGQSFKHKRIDFDQKLFDMLKDGVIAFWDMVQSKTAPMAMGLDNGTIQGLFPTSDETMQEVEDLNQTIAYLQETKMHIKEMEKEKAEIEAKIKQRIGENLGVKTSEYVVKWSNQNRASIDTARMKEDGAYEKYKKITPMRVLRVRNTGGSK